MSAKNSARRQYRAIVDRAASRAVAFRVPSEGWLRSARKALGMSGAQLARRAGVTRARIAAAEQAELSGGITLKSMQAAAEAMGCRFVYAIVPPRSVDDLLTAQARKKALAVVGEASGHMALENQTLPKAKIENEVARLAADLAREIPRDFWDEE